MTYRILLLSLFASALSIGLFADIPKEGPSEWTPTEEQWKSLLGGEVVVVKKTPAKSEPAASQAAMAAILINQKTTPIWNILEDKESTSKFIDSITSSKIVGQEGGFDLVEQKMKIGPTKITYVIKHMSEEPRAIRFTLHSGDLKELEGLWEFIPVQGGEQTMLVYHLSLQPGFPVPGFLLRNSLAKSLPDALVSIRKEVGRRNGAE